jgi:hypothetical protein
MKQTVKNTAMAIGLIMSMAVAPSAMAGTGIKTPGIELKFTGKENNQPVFQLDIENSAKELYFVTIKDQDGVVLYEETLAGEKINRRFRLNTEELSGAVLTVEVAARKSAAKPVVFEIKSTPRIVEEHASVTLVQ